MRPTLSVIFITLLGFIANGCFSQNGSDTILLLSGNTIITTIVDTTNGIVRYKNPKHPKKTSKIENDQIFSINNSNGKTLVYAYDTINGNEYTVDEMRYFIFGEQDANKAIEAPGAFWGNLLCSAGAGVTGSFWAPIVPFAFSGITTITKVKIKEETISDPEYFNHETYRKGYEHEGRKKRKITSLVGGGIGLFIGLGTSFILKADGIELLK